MTLALPSGPIAHAIGWALLHLVWQGALVAAVLAALLSRLSSRSASLRYALSCAALALIVALGVATAVRSYPGPTPTASTRLPLAEAAIAAQAALPSQAPAVALPGPPDRWRSFVHRANEALPAVVMTWIVGVAILSIRLILDWLRARRLVARGTSRAEDPWQAVVRRLSLALGVRRAVRLLESAAVEVPSVLGFVRPAILLPASTLTGLTPAQLEMILAHELAHIRRHDFLVNLFQTVVETLLFYHPAVWWISRQIRNEREHCCDDLAVAVCGSPLHYARALARLEELRPRPSLLAVSATGGSLLERVRRLVGSTTPTGSAVRGASAVAILSCALLMLAAQTFSAIGTRPQAAERADHGAATGDDPAPADRSEAQDRAPLHGPATRDPEPRQGSAAVATVAESEAPPDPDAGPAPDPDAGPAPEPDAVAESEERPSLDELIALRTHNVTPEMIREVRSLFPELPLTDIASMFAVGATPEFVREMRQIGLDVSNAGDAQGLAAVGVTREFVRAMRRVGFPCTSPGEAQGLKAVGVTPEYVRAMRHAGFPLETAPAAQNLMAVGVTPDYVREMREVGIELDQEEVTSLCALGITPGFVRRLAKAGYPNPSVDQLKRLGAAGVTGDFVQEMSKYRTR